jgi:hypothetical protein
MNFEAAAPSRELNEQVTFLYPLEVLFLNALLSLTGFLYELQKIA